MGLGGYLASLARHVQQSRAMAPQTRIKAWFCAGALTVSVMTQTPSAQGQEATVAGVADIMSGIEGGGSGYAKGVRRARTSLRFGAEGWIDESPNNLLGLAALIEIEPRASIGADLRYIRLVGDSFAFHAGAIGIIAPKHMIGATFGAAYRLTLGEHAVLNFGPTGQFYFLGADLPEDAVIWQAMFQAGARGTF